MAFYILLGRFHVSLCHFPKSKQISSKKKVFFEIFTVNSKKPAKKRLPEGSFFH